MVLFSQNGYRASEYSLMAAYTVPGTSVKVVLRKGDVSVVLLYLLKQFNATVQPLRQADTGGYNPRAIRAGVSLSNHASGTAVDVRWADHPLKATGTFTPVQLMAIRKILSFCDGVVRWGGDYTGRKDEMHFEVNASLVRVAELADKIRNGGKKVESQPAIGSASVVLKLGSKGPLIKLLQERLNAVFPAYSRLKTDGQFGPKLEAVIKEFQRRTGLTPDGAIGPKTRAMLKRFGIIL